MFQTILITITVLLCIVHQSVSSREEVEAIVLEALDHCVEKHGIAKSEVQKIRGGDLSGVDRNIKCGAHCVFEKLNVMNAAANLNMEEANKLMMMDKENMPKYANMCAVITRDDVCEKSFDILMCMVDVAEGRA